VAKESEVKLIPIAWDALAFIVNPSNPVDNLSSEQIKNIFSGKITNWSTVGGIKHDTSEPLEKNIAFSQRGQKKISDEGTVNLEQGKELNSKYKYWKKKSPTASTFLVH